MISCKLILTFALMATAVALYGDKRPVYGGDENEGYGQQSAVESYSDQYPSDSEYLKNDEYQKEDEYQKGEKYKKDDKYMQDKHDKDDKYKKEKYNKDDKYKKEKYNKDDKYKKEKYNKDDKYKKEKYDKDDKHKNDEKYNVKAMNNQYNNDYKDNNKYPNGTAPSKNLLTFLSIFNGYYTNARQKFIDNVNVGLGDEHDLLGAIWRPVQVAAFPNQWAIYLEETMLEKKKIVRMTLLVLSEDDFGVIHAQPLNVVPPDGYRPGDYEYADLTNIALESLTVPPECEVLFARVEENAYVGSYPDCVSLAPGPPSRYGFTITCNQFSALLCSRNSNEIYGKLPYIHIKKRRYPLPLSVTSAAYYTVPCNFN